MIMEINKNKYISFKVYAVTKIKNKYGFRILLTLQDGKETITQKSGFRTKSEANEARNIAITELHNGTFIMDDSITVEFFFTQWLENVMRINLTYNSYESYKNIVYNYVIPKLGKKKMTSLNCGHIRKFYNEITNISISIAKLCKTVINTALKYATANNVIQYNPSVDINLPKEVKKEKYRTRVIDSKKTINAGQMKLLIIKAKDTPIYLHVLFAALMGLRKSEINGLKYSDIDYIHRTLKIQRQLGKRPNTSNEEIKIGEYTKQEIKVKTYSSNRDLDIPDVLFEAILEERKKYEKNKSRRINDKTAPFKDYGFICCSTYGNPRSKGFHTKYWKNLLKECELPDMRFHDLRASYCTLLLKNNFNEKAVSKLLGHASEIVTIDHYADNEELITDCLEELEPFIESVLPKKDEKIESDFSEDNQILDTMELWISNSI